MKKRLANLALISACLLMLSSCASLLNKKIAENCERNNQQGDVSYCPDASDEVTAFLFDATVVKVAIQQLVGNKNPEKDLEEFEKNQMCLDKEEKVCSALVGCECVVKG